jgi:hypothetical protein
VRFRQRGGVLGIDLDGGSQVVGEPGLLDEVPVGIRGHHERGRHRQTGVGELAE